MNGFPKVILMIDSVESWSPAMISSLVVTLHELHRISSEQYRGNGNGSGSEGMRNRNIGSDLLIQRKRRENMANKENNAMAINVGTIEVMDMNVNSKSSSVSSTRDGRGEYDLAFLPFVLVLGVATTRNVLSLILEPNAFAMLSTRVFHFQPSITLYTRLAEHILYDTSPVFMNDKIVSRLLQNFEYFDHSINRFHDHIRFLFHCYFQTPGSQFAVYLLVRPIYVYHVLFFSFLFLFVCFVLFV